MVVGGPLLFGFSNARTLLFILERRNRGVFVKIYGDRKELTKI